MRAEDTYPLKALLELRRRIKEHRARCLAAEARGLGEAEIALGTARGRVLERETHLALQRARLSPDGTPERVRSVQDLQTAEQYTSRVVRDLERLRDTWRRAERAVAEARDRHAAAREKLLAAAAGLKMVERHFGTWDLERRRQEARRAEQELEDLVAAIRAGSSSERKRPL
jgi:hypothetical protein